MIVGNGPDLDYYKSCSRQHQLQRIHFEGQQSPEKYYKDASIFLMTSIGIEGWGLTITESLQRGVVPVIMNTCSVYSEIIENGVNGLLTKGSNHSDFTTQLKLLMSSLTLHLRMQEAGLNSASRFQINPIID